MLRGQSRPAASAGAIQGHRRRGDSVLIDEAGHAADHLQLADDGRTPSVTAARTTWR